ncbi:MULTISPECIES: hypothetical protein [Priestia]|uniref:hypothetical protein n=1 Tax=Priestia TaxID=2800373 RepID=UPI00112BDB73|nr:MULTISPECIES: hypothetical protein [Priestia]
MTKQVVITRKVNAKTNFTPTREFYSVLVDGKDPHVGAMPNTPLVDVVEAVLRRLKDVAIHNEEEAFDVAITTPVDISDVVKTFIKDKYELEPQFNSVVFS